MLQASIFCGSDVDRGSLVVNHGFKPLEDLSAYVGVISKLITFGKFMDLKVTNLSTWLEIKIFITSHVKQSEVKLRAVIRSAVEFYQVLILAKLFSDRKIFKALLRTQTPVIN